MAIGVPGIVFGIQRWNVLNDIDQSGLGHSKHFWWNENALFTIEVVVGQCFFRSFCAYLPAAPFFRVLYLVAFGISPPGLILLQQIVETQRIESRKSKICLVMFP